MFKLRNNKSDFDEKIIFNEGKSVENYEIQTLNFVKNTLPLFMDSIAKMRSSRFKSFDKKSVYRFNSESLIKPKATEEPMPKEHGNITNLKFQGKRAFYEYTGAELDMVRDDVKRKEKKKNQFK